MLGHPNIRRYRINGIVEQRTDQILIGVVFDLTRSTVDARSAPILSS
jgi:hypothetical protein